MLLTALFILLGLLALSVPVAAALGVLGLALSEIYSIMPLHLAIGDSFWQYGTDFLLMAIPMFILLGELLLRSGIAARMYAALAQWLSWLPGGLMHSNIGSCAMFAATSGS
ncbi:MAG: TRAP transporter large permease subunit, partial [Alphaproteobacteria bacterium]